MNPNLIGARARGILQEIWPSLADTTADGSRVSSFQSLAGEFGSDAAAIEEAKTPIAPSVVLYVLLTCLVILILWAIVGTTDRIVIGHGKITTGVPIIVVQPFQTERIAAIFVRAGDHVKKGAPLVSFDPAFAQADVSAIEAKYSAETAEQARIEAELAGRIYDPGANASADERAQADIFQRHTAELASELDSRDSRLKRIAAEVEANNGTMKDLKREVQLAEKVLSMYRRLTTENAGVPLSEIESEQKLLDAQVRVKDLTVANAKLSEEQATVVADRKAFLDKWNNDLNQRLVELRQNNAQSKDNLVKARKLKDLTELDAPFDAVVLQLGNRSIGSVVREAETLVTLVPANAPLVLEADIASSDVGYAKIGDKVRVKLEAYPFQQFGTLDGSLEEMSPDSLPGKGSGGASTPVFRSRVRLNDTVNDLSRRHIHLGAGLVATAEIKTGKRSIASYILYPFIGTFDEAMREP